jgi:hypothetical protein
MVPDKATFTTTFDAFFLKNKSFGPYHSHTTTGNLHLHMVEIHLQVKGIKTHIPLKLKALPFRFCFIQNNQLK